VLPANYLFNDPEELGEDDGPDDDDQACLQGLQVADQEVKGLSGRHSDCAKNQKDNVEDGIDDDDDDMACLLALQDADQSLSILFAQHTDNQNVAACTTSDNDSEEDDN
jgi:hypothetical protein